MGSKRKLATRILAAMPRRDTLVDLFCGGCAVAHAAMDGGKFENIIINDINPMCTQLFTRALRGEYRDERRWISREDFERLKHTDPYVAIVWSFGNNMRDYMYSREVEPLKRAMHYAIYFSDFTPLEELLPGICVEGMTGVSEEYKRYTLVKHQVKNYLRDHDQAANANLQHSTAINLVTGGVGGGTNSTQRERCSNISTGDYSCVVRLHQWERNDRLLQLHQSKIRGGAKSRCSIRTTARWKFQKTASSTATFPTRIHRCMVQRSNVSVMRSFTNGARSSTNRSSSAATPCPTSSLPAWRNTPTEVHSVPPPTTR